MNSPSSPKSPIPGMKQIFMGAVGSGKTSALRSYIKHGLQVRAIFTEPSHEVVTDLTCEQGFHYTYIEPTAESWQDILDNATKVNTLPNSILVKQTDLGRSKFQGFLKFIKACNDFKCDRCGQKYGDASTWGTGVVLWVDSLTALSDMAMQNVVGGKPIKDLPDWQTAMDQTLAVVNALAVSSRCHVGLCAHLEMELDPVAGEMRVMVATLGKKLAPKVPRYYSDVILCKRQGTNFTWSTTASNFELKARNFPFADNLPPDVGPALAGWKARGGIIEEI